MTEYKLLTPTVDIVKDFAEQWKTDSKTFADFKDKYKDNLYIPEDAQEIFAKSAANDEKLREIFDKYPNNNDENEVLFKVVLLDKLYNTDIKAPVKIAKEIARKEINIAQNNEINTNLVDEIAHTGSRYEFSFASKFCHWHNYKYPIYDSYIVKLLAEYNKIGGHHFYGDTINTINYISTKPERSLKKYEYFHSAYKGFKKSFEIGDCSVKETDIFLWMYGKFLSREETARKKQVKKNEN